jgi:hypothetical protein
MQDPSLTCPAKTLTPEPKRATARRENAEPMPANAKTLRLEPKRTAENSVS